MPIVAKQRVHFGPFELDTRAGELYKHEFKLKLQGHPIQILAMLLERPGELITREEIQQKLWPSESETFVDFEHGLNTAVRKLRQALSDEAETPQYIETLPRRGYRFVGEIADQVLSAAVGSEIDSIAPDVAHAEPHVAAIPPVPNAVNATVLPGGADQRWRLSIRLVALLLLPVLLGMAAVLLLPMWFGPRTMKVVNSKRLTFNEHVGLRPMAIVGQRPVTTLEFYDSMHGDGRRIYYTIDADQPLRYMSVNGGQENVLSSTLPSLVLLHISPDGSMLLIKSLGAETGETKGDLWTMPADGGPARKIGDIKAQDAAFAPDGKTIAFAQGQEIFLTNLIGDNPVKLATAPGRVFWMRWSPDGTKLRFTVTDPKNLTYTLWDLEGNGILRQLLTDWHKDAQICCGIWTARGEYFLFRQIRTNGDEIWVWPKRGLAASATEPSLLNSGGIELGSIVASPLKRELYATVSAPSVQVLVRDPTNGDVRPLDIGMPALRATYSRDGKMMAAIVQDPDGGALWRTRSDGNDKQQLTAAPMQVFMADYSPDGQRIAFMAHKPDQPWKIYWVAANGGALREISSEVAEQADPNWSPDGQSILYGQPTNFAPAPGSRWDLYLYELRTGKSSRLPDSMGLFSPRWSPDGRYVAALSLDQRSLTLIDLKTGGRRKWEGRNFWHPFWSLDSQWVYFNSGMPMSLWRLRAGDGHMQPVDVRIDPQRCSPWIANGANVDGSLLFTCIQVHRDIYALEWK